MHLPTKGTLQEKKKKKKKRSTKDLFDDVYAFFPIFVIKAYVVVTHLNCIDKSMQFKWAPITYAFIKL